MIRPLFPYASQPNFCRKKGVMERRLCITLPKDDLPAVIEKKTSNLVLLVEDNLATAVHIGDTLAQQTDYRVVFASDWWTAWKFLRTCKPDLVLLDERLLTRNGIELAQRLRVMKDLQDIPLLLFEAGSPEST
jgi:CheY-like chemotaxis protein